MRLIRDFPDHATFREKSVTTGQVGQALGFPLFDPIGYRLAMAVQHSTVPIALINLIDHSELRSGPYESSQKSSLYHSFNQHNLHCAEGFRGNEYNFANLTLGSSDYKLIEQTHVFPT